MTVIEFLLPSFVACLLLAAIHSYLGIHVLTRGIIFIDIAMAQMAALGITVAHLFHFHHDDQMAYLFGLFFSLMAAIFFTLFRKKDISQEALIGASFALASALSLLIADKLPHGADHLKHILDGNILWVTWPQISKTALIYLLTGIFYFFSHQKLYALSSQSKGLNKKQSYLWDFLFYTSFAIVITSSVQMGGVLLVFSYLIIPTYCSFLFFKSLKARLISSFTLSCFGSLLGLSASHQLDLPSGSSIVSSLALIFLVSIVVDKIRKI